MLQAVTDHGKAKNIKTLASALLSEREIHCVPNRALSQTESNTEQDRVPSGVEGRGQVYNEIKLN